MLLLGLKEDKISLSLEKRQSQLQTAVDLKYPPVETATGMQYSSVMWTWNDHLVFVKGGESFRVGYTVKGNKVTLKDDLIKVEKIYVPVNESVGTVTETQLTQDDIIFGQCLLGLIDPDLEIMEAQSLRNKMRKAFRTRYPGQGKSDMPDQIVEDYTGKATKDVEWFSSIREAEIDKKSKTVKIVILESGTNTEKGRHYPVATVKEAAPKFAGLKMYMNHSTTQEDMQRPERALEDWVATIKESWYDEKLRAAVGVAHVHSPVLVDLLEDKVTRKELGVSIHAGSRSYFSKINGAMTQVIESIVMQKASGAPASVDWVTEAGMGGRVLEILESWRDDMSQLKSVDLQTLRNMRPDLAEALIKEGKAQAVDETASASQQGDQMTLTPEIKEAVATAVAEETKPLKESVTTLQSENAELKTKNKSLEDKNLLDVQKAKVRKQVKESGLSEAVQCQVMRRIGDNLIPEDKFKDVVENAIKDEKSYLEGLDGGNGAIKLGHDGKDGTNAGGDVVESVGDRLEKRFKVKDPEKEKKEKKEDE